MTKLLDNEGMLPQAGLQFGVFDDFFEYVSGDMFTTVASDSGTVSVGDAAGGVLAIVPSDGTVADNDESYVKGTKELFLFAANKPLLFECRAQYTEANTDDANVILGVMNAVAANALQDNGAGPPASYSGAVFFKADGDTVWSCETSIGGTQTTTQLTASNANNISKTAQTAGGASYKTFRIEFLPYSSTNADVRFYIDGVLVARHDFVFTSATEMQLVAGQKNGDTTNVETLNVDFIGCYQRR